MRRHHHLRPDAPRRAHEPDLSYVLNTTVTVAEHLRRGQLVVLESTTYPGTTDEDMLPILEAGGLKARPGLLPRLLPRARGPGRTRISRRPTIPKVVGGLTPGLPAGWPTLLYGQIVVRTVPVSSTRAAESTKLLENIFRCVNIALVNELKMIFDRMGIDVWEVIGAASTKPFGFMPFYPGPGLGGHCIPIDPFYLTWKAKEVDYQTQVHRAGRRDQHLHAVLRHREDGRRAERTGEVGQGAPGSSSSASPTRRTSTTRASRRRSRSSSLFQGKGAKVSYNDPYIPRARATANTPTWISSPSR